MDYMETARTAPAALVEFYRDNDMACAQATVAVNEAAKQLGDEAPVLRINVDTDPQESHLVRVTIVPTIIIYRQGREEWRHEGGNVTAKELVERVRATLLPPGAEFHHRPGYTGRR